MSVIKQAVTEKQQQIIELINSIISPLELADDFIEVIKEWQNSFEDDIVLESINASARQYLKKYLKNDKLDKASIHQFLDKIPAIAKNKSLPLILQKFIYIQNICKSKKYDATMQEIDEVLNIVNIKLAEAGISHELIISIFDDYIIPMTWKTNVFDEWVYNLQGFVKQYRSKDNGSL